jgi:outer membrane protein
MNRHIAIFFLGVSLIFASMMPADAAGGSGKVAMVDLQRTLRETNAGKSAKRRFDAYKRKKQAKLDRMQKEFQKYAKQLKKQAAVLKPAVLRQRQQELQRKYVAVQELYVKLERELAAHQAKLIKRILKKAAPAIKSIARSEGYSIVLDRSAVLYFDNAVDITTKVNRRIK